MENPKGSKFNWTKQANREYYCASHENISMAVEGCKSQMRFLIAVQRIVDTSTADIISRSKFYTGTIDGAKMEAERMARLL